MLALWVTNRERHRRFVDTELLPAWGLHHVATWYWLKVTDDGQLVSSLVLLSAENIAIHPFVTLRASVLCQVPSSCLQRMLPHW